MQASCRNLQRFTLSSVVPHFVASIHFCQLSLPSFSQESCSTFSDCFINQTLESFSKCGSVKGKQIEVDSLMGTEEIQRLRNTLGGRGYRATQRFEGSQMRDGTHFEKSIGCHGIFMGLCSQPAFHSVNISRLQCCCLGWHTRSVSIPLRLQARLLAVC